MVAEEGILSNEHMRWEYKAGSTRKDELFTGLGGVG